MWINGVDVSIRDPELKPGLNDRLRIEWSLRLDEVKQLELQAAK
jgi:hypothetical protein